MVKCPYPQVMAFTTDLYPLLLVLAEALFHIYILVYCSKVLVGIRNVLLTLLFIYFFVVK